MWWSALTRTMTSQTHMCNLIILVMYEPLKWNKNISNDADTTNNPESRKTVSIIDD